MALIPGVRLGPYEILSPLGAGGMGEVYRARDTKLGRDVAIKVLPEAFVSDPERVARFQREAKTLASLNHPNIGGIHGLEESGGVTALVMELVEGEDLSQRIARGAIPIDEALHTARQIAEALEAAHEQGIIHRDLKPANIKVRPDGTVKVLDFGLAKAMEPVGRAPDVSQSPTITMPAMTQAGMILGTTAYMSPEQAAGKISDKRSDIWSFGVVLMEMLTGEPVFAGETVSHVMAAVLRADPDWSALPPNTPAAIRRVLRRCLDKAPKRRLDSAAAVRLELEDAQTSPAAEVSPARVPRRVVPVAIASVVGGALLATLALWTFTRPAPPAAAPLARFTITPPAALPLTLSLQAAARDFAVAPDGSFLIYRSGHAGQLVVRWLDQLDAAPLTGIESAVMPFVSPDSKWIGFVQDDLALKKVAVTGGAPVTLTRLPVWPRGASWVDDDTIIIGTNSLTTGLLRVPAGGGDPTVLTTPNRARGEEGHVLPSRLPGGHAVLFTIGAAEPENAQIALLDLQTRTQTMLLRGGRDAQYVASGHLVASSRSQSSQTSGASRRSARQSCAGVTRTAQKRARHGAWVPLRHETSRHRRGACVAAQARASMVCVSGGNRRRVRGRPLPVSGAGASSTGVPRNTLRSDETPTAYGSLARCNTRRSVALSPNSASPTTAVTVNPAERTWRNSVNANCHFGSNTTVAGIRARARWRGVSHSSGRYNVAPSSHARVDPGGPRVGRRAIRPVASGGGGRPRAGHRRGGGHSNRRPERGGDRSRHAGFRAGRGRRRDAAVAGVG